MKTLILKVRSGDEYYTPATWCAVYLYYGQIDKIARARDAFKLAKELTPDATRLTVSESDYAVSWFNMTDDLDERINSNSTPLDDNSWVNTMVYHGQLDIPGDAFLDATSETAWIRAEGTCYRIDDDVIYWACYIGETEQTTHILDLKTVLSLAEEETT